MVKVCDCCSGITAAELKAVGLETVESGCIDHCAGFDGKVFGLIEGELVVVESKEAFLEQVKK